METGYSGVLILCLRQRMLTEHDALMPRVALLSNPGKGEKQVFLSFGVSITSITRGYHEIAFRQQTVVAQSGVSNLVRNVTRFSYASH
uniref:hypothetical protein n=1 Tax=Yersinia enterocolitica TaxID=630 RepID=UPI001459DAAD|nr:hypothetical protein [Yersinia enterocolitica]